MSRRQFSLPGAVLLAVLLVACGPSADGSRDEPAPSPSPGVAAADDGSAGAVSATPQNGGPGQRREAAARTNFNNLCATCHGSNPSGGRAPTLFNTALLNERSDEYLRQTILEGVPVAGMPPFAGVLDETQIFQLLAYIRNEAADYAERPVFIPSPDGQVVHSQKQSFRIDVLATGLEVPWGMAFLPDGRILVTERSGHLRIIEDDDLLPDPVSGTPEVQVGQDAGLLDIALHPDYESNG